MENSRKSWRKKIFLSVLFPFSLKISCCAFFVVHVGWQLLSPQCSFVHSLFGISHWVFFSFFLLFVTLQHTWSKTTNNQHTNNQQWAPLWSTTQSQRTTATTSVWALRGLPTSLVSVSSSSLSRTPWTCMSSATSETHTTLLLARASCQGTQTDTTRTGSTDCSSEPLTMPSSSLVTLTSIRLIVLPSQRVPGWGLLWTHVPYLPEHWVLHWTSHWSQ